MTHLETVEKLRSVANLSYEQAKAVLERNNWDLLDAMIELEKAGQTDGGASYTAPEKNTYFTAEPKKHKSNAFSRAVRWCWELVKKSCRNSVAAVRRGETLLELPILVFIVLICCFGIILPVMIVGLFFDLRYTIHGPDITGTMAADMVESVSDKAADIADAVKERVNTEIDKHKSDNQ